MLTFVRDIIPRYRTRIISGILHEEYVRYPYVSYKAEIETDQFLIACEALEMSRDFAVGSLNTLYWSKISEGNREWHLRQYPKGGMSSVFSIGSSGGSQ